MRGLLLDRGHILPVLYPALDQVLCRICLPSHLQGTTLCGRGMQQIAQIPHMVEMVFSSNKHLESCALLNSSCSSASSSRGDAVSEADAMPNITFCQDRGRATAVVYPASRMCMHRGGTCLSSMSLKSASMASCRAPISFPANSS